jgi:hypothetical protein
VNYAALDVEELGSVYESLLDFHPQIRKRHGMHEFVLALGSDRKTTGSYYTPPQLVGQLIKTALEPVIAEKLKSIQKNNVSGSQTPAFSGSQTPAVSGSQTPAGNQSPKAPPSSKIEAEPQELRYQAEPSNEDNQAEPSNEDKEQALLSLKIIDPACGSGHFLLAAARRLGKELARIRTGEVQPAPETLRQAIRDVIQNCIYGVDLNPLAVDLCKVALWIEGFSRGLPLNFLDHRIKCGNSLVGVLDLNCLDEGIPDEAFKPVTGDDKKLASSIKKENKKQRQTDLQGQLSLNLYGNLQQERTQYVEEWRDLGEISEETTADVRRKQEKYQQNRQNTGWWRDYSACNLWTAAFFMGLTQENLQLLPTTEALTRLVRSSASAHSGEEVLKHNYEQSIQNIVDAANKLAEEKRFFHWCLEFPEVFEQGGFSCVLGNPPWERIKLQEKEFFASRDEKIAKAANKAARNKLIKGLAKTNPQLAQEFEEAKHDADAQGKFIRESSRFPLTAVGDINTYAVFAETNRLLISKKGRAGFIIQSDIATADSYKEFFADLLNHQQIISFYDFVNTEGIFPAVHRTHPHFCLITLSGNLASQPANFAFWNTNFKHLADTNRSFNLSKNDLFLLNPNTLTCLIFRTRTDAELTKKIYQRVPVLENEQTGSNPWGISFMRMLDMANDSGLFHNQPGNNLVPLYEAKMFHQFDHRWATYKDSGDTGDLSDEEKSDSSFQIQPRYWVSRNEVENKLGDKWKKDWLLGFRRISNTTNERTFIFSIIPKAGCGDSVFIIIPKTDVASIVSCLYAYFNSLIFDFITRQKMGGTNLSFFIVKQLPILPPESYTQEDIEFISTRVLELVYTAWDMQPFALDMGYDGEAFIWNSERRALLRAELDAYYAKLYGLTRDELRYILDPANVYGEDFPSETFRVLKNNEIKQFGEYRTQRLVLSAWDKMFGNG